MDALRDSASSTRADPRPWRDAGSAPPTISARRSRSRRMPDPPIDSPDPPKDRRSMNQRKPLQRKTPLRAKSPWRPERTPLRHRSAKMSKIYVQRRALVAEILSQRPLCEARWDDRCSRMSVDVHEILPRSQGGRIIGGASSEYLAVCRWCHDQIETHPSEAHDRGFRRWSWEGNEQ